MRKTHEDGFKTWPELDMQEVERVGRSLAALFGITLDETATVHPGYDVTWGQDPIVTD